MKRRKGTYLLILINKEKYKRKERLCGSTRGRATRLQSLTVTREPYEVVPRAASWLQA